MLYLLGLFINVVHYVHLLFLASLKLLKGGLAAAVL